MKFRLSRSSIVLIPSALVILAVACVGGEDDPAPLVTSVGITATPQQSTATAAPIPTSPRVPTVAPTPAPTATTASQPTATATPRSPTPTPTPSAPSLARAKAISLGAAELGVPAADISVLSQDPATWASTGLGCEVRGQVYAQVLISGWKIVVNGGGIALEIHADALGENVISCSTAISLASTPSLNLVEAANLNDITSIVVLALPADSTPVEFVKVDDASIIENALDALAGATHLAERSDCTTLFQIDFVSDSGTVSLMYACSGAGETIRGDQAFWNGQDGIAPGPFQKIINGALAAREFPAFPPQN